MFSRVGQLAGAAIDHAARLLYWKVFGLRIPSRIRFLICGRNATSANSGWRRRVPRCSTGQTRSSAPKRRWNGQWGAPPAAQRA